ncbi:hypothetical protein ABIE65_004884 [Constrictibacter sp. MBR-5]|jgi:hypothetical protein|uniref:hypothetical protein n=1 Tax=Constrictibacter sp. MBR-5 TaxID=3156467 RepID=UPI003390B972
MTDHREIQVIDRSSGEVVHRVDVTGKGEVECERIASKLRQTINEEEFYLDDTAAGRLD